MSDVVEQGKSMLGTIEYAKAKGITQAYPDSSVAEVVGNLVAEVERLHSWAGLMSLLDEHWPDDIFPTAEDREDRDPGPRIVSLLRWVDMLQKRVQGLESLMIGATE